MGRTAMDYKLSPMNLNLLSYEREATYGNDVYLLSQYLQMVECINTGDDNRMAIIVKQFAGKDIDEVGHCSWWLLNCAGCLMFIHRVLTPFPVSV